MSKEELDRIFQEGAENYDFPYNPAAWEHMQQLLDEQRRRRWILWWLWGGFVVVLLFITGWFLIWPDAGAPDRSPDATLENLVPPAATPENNPRKDVAPPPGSPTRRPTTPSTQQNNREKPIANLSASQEATWKAHPNEASLLPTAHGGAVPPPTLSSASNAKQPSAIEPPAEESPAARPPLVETLPFLPVKPLEQLVGPAGETLEFDLLLPDAPILASASTPSRLLFSAQFAPNYSSVGINDQLETGGSAGLGIAYFLGQKLLIGLDVELSRKTYLANSGDYTPPYGFWTRKIAPSETLGKCTILEIPLSLTQYFGPFHRAGGFAQAGIASYLMLRENYYYRYEQSDPDLIRWWQTKNENQHWLSVINLSGGYRRPIGYRYALNLGPFLNIPLGGVGHGKVKLYSFGVNLRMDFRPS